MKLTRLSFLIIGLLSLGLQQAFAIEVGLDVNSINLPKIINAAKMFANQYEIDQKNIQEAAAKALQQVPFKILDIDNIDIDMLKNRGQLLRKQYEARYGDRIREYIDEGRDIVEDQAQLINEVREKIAKNVTHALAVLRIAKPSLDNILVVMDLIKSPILVNIPREYITDEAYEALQNAIEYAQSEQELVKAFGQKHAAFVNVIGKYIKENFGTAAQVRNLTDEQIVQKLRELVNKSEPHINKIREFIENNINKIDQDKIDQIMALAKKININQIKTDKIAAKVKSLSTIF